jgi:hypothetical protein
MNHFHLSTQILQLHIYLLSIAKVCSHLLIGIKISLRKTKISNIEQKHNRKKLADSQMQVMLMREG